MQRIMNNPDDIVDEMLAGFVKCHSDIVKLVKTGEENPRGVVAAVDAPIADKVGIVTGGGSGHAFGLVTIGEDSVIPDGVQIGKNTAIKGVTEPSDYPDGVLAGGETLIKVGDR